MISRHPPLPSDVKFSTDFQNDLENNHEYLQEYNEDDKNKSKMRLLYTFNNGMFLKYTQRGQKNIIDKVFGIATDKQISTWRHNAERDLSSLERKKNVHDRLSRLRKVHGIIPQVKNNDSIQPLKETSPVSDARKRLVSDSRRNRITKQSMVRKGGRKTRKNSNWIQFVKRVHNDEKKINKNFTYKKAMKKAASMNH